MYFGTATPEDVAKAVPMLDGHGWGYHSSDLGERCVARDDDGSVVGFLRLIDTPEGVYVTDVIVHPDRRGSGIGSDLMRSAMETRSGPFFLVCHPERLAFYRRLGFDSTDRSTWPTPVVEASKAEDDWDSSHEHLHHYMLRGPS